MIIIHIDGDKAESTQKNHMCDSLGNYTYGFIYILSSMFSALLLFSLLSCLPYTK